MKQPFKKPEEYDDEETVQVCCRVKRSTKEALDAAASKCGTKAKPKTLGWLAGNILDDYAEFLREKK